MQDTIQLSKGESLALAKEISYWDGFIAGAKAAAEHAKGLALRDVINVKQAHKEMEAEIREASNGRGI